MVIQVDTGIDLLELESNQPNILLERKPHQTMLNQFKILQVSFIEEYKEIYHPNMNAEKKKNKHAPTGDSSEGLTSHWKIK